MPTTRREARLRPEYAALYAGVPAGEWRPIAELLDCVAASRLRSGRGSGEVLRARLLDERHFEFRGGEDRRGVTLPFWLLFLHALALCPPVMTNW